MYNSSEFSGKIFNEICKVLPETTCRGFSKDCGMSEGYFGSIQSQKLPISTQALVFLLENLEVKKQAMSYSGKLVQMEKVKDIQQMITNEIAVRSNNEANATHGTIRKMLYEAICRRAEENFNPYSSAPPISIGF